MPRPALLAAPAPVPVMLMVAAVPPLPVEDTRPLASNFTPMLSLPVTAPPFAPTIEILPDTDDTVDTAAVPLPM